MKRSIVVICLLAVVLTLNACRNLSTATAVQATDVESLNPDQEAGSVAGDPQNNSSLTVILGSTIGGEPGLYISKQMDVQAENMSQHKMNGARIERFGEGIKITFDGNATFAENSSTLSEGSRKNLDRIASTLIEYNNTKLIIEGHTDETGSARHNLALSQKRARAVAKYLGQKGVDLKKVDVIGYGEKYPLFSNATAQGRLQNRRVEVIIIADDNLKAEARNKYP